MRRLAVTISVVGLLAMAAVSWCSGCPAFTCAVRSAAGGVVLYVVVTVAGRIFTAVAADAIVRSMSDRANRNDRSERPA